MGENLCSPTTENLGLIKFKGRDNTKIACVIKNSQDYVEHLKLKRNVTDPNAKFGLDGGKQNR